MGKIFKGQTALTINVNICSDITGATIELSYKKPDGTQGVFPQQSIVIKSRLKGLIEYRPLDESDLDQIGLWTFWSTVTFADGTKAHGDVFCEEVFRVGT